MTVHDIRDGMISIAIFVAMMVLAFWAGRMVGQADAENELIAKTDTVIRTDTVKVPKEVLQTQVVMQEVVRYKYVPVTIDTDPLAKPAGAVEEEKRDTDITVQDGVAVIPIMQRTYTDSATYRAVVSGYDPRLEDIEVYQKQTVVTVWKAAPRWSVGIQAGVYMTPNGVQPGIGVGVGYRIW